MKRFPELTETSEAILIGATAGAPVEEIARDVHLSESIIRSRIWAAIRRIWRKRKLKQESPTTLGEIPVAILLMEAPELIQKQVILLAALPMDVDLDATRLYLGRYGTCASF